MPDNALDDRIIPADKLQLTMKEAEFAAEQVVAADDPVPDPATMMDGGEETDSSPSAAGPKAQWPANDADAPDYRHLSDSQITPDATFDLTPDDIELVLAANRFDPHGKFQNEDATANEVIALAVRGLAIGKKAEIGTKHEVELARSVEVTDVRPDHDNFRCIVGFYIRTQDPAARRVTLFSGSTVPNAKLMTAYRDKVAHHTPEPFEKCNMLPTGCYVCRVDRHKTIRPALRMAEPDDLKRDAHCTVLRTFNDLTYGLNDLWDLAQPYDNVHCAYAISHNSNWGASFSSEGCVTVRGRPAPSDHQWAKFQAVLNRIGSQRRCDLVLVTGRDLALAANLRNTAQAANAQVVQRELVRLRAGSMGEDVRRLRARLGLADGTYFGATVRSRLAERQADQSHSSVIDGVYSPALDVQCGWNVFQPG